MTRLLSVTLLLAVAACLFALGTGLLGPAAGLLAPRGATAEEEKKPETLTIASDDVVEAALKKFKTDYKAKGVPSEEKVMYREWAMRQIAKLQHPDVIKALGKVSKSGDEDLCLYATLYLGEQKALPHLAAKHVLAAMKRGKKSEVMQLTGLQSLANLSYLGARKEIGDLLKHQSYAVKKEAIITIGYVKDIRMLAEILRLIGMKIDMSESAKDSRTGTKEGSSDSGPEVVEEGYSWEGVEVTYDTGTSGDHDQKMAEKIGKEKLAQNKAAADAAHAGKGGGGGMSNGAGAGGGSGMSGGRGGASRSTEELIPHILRTLKRLTGEEFKSPGTIRKWLKVNQEAVRNNIKLLDKKEKDQKEAR